MSNITVRRAIQIISTQEQPEAAGTGGAKKNIEALALSAGGMFAAYQAGVYKALWPYWKPDLVVGASAGALNAWLVAARIDPDELIDRWLSPDAAATLKFRDRFNPWKGFCDPDPLLAHARGLLQEFKRELPLGVVSIELPRFRPRMFRDEQVTAQHLVASCAIPFVYPMVRIEGRRLVDGGLFEPTPIWAAAAMGATRVIGIDALPRVTPWPIHAVLGTMHRIRKMPVAKSLDVSVIKPSEAMGSARQAIIWERSNIVRWVELGIRDGEQFLKTWGGP
jgi:NTE family protein